MSMLMNITPQKAVIAETGEMVGVEEVEVNTILAVKAGEVIPIDGIVVDGRCEVDEKTLTGESFPVPKQKDSVVWAGTINLNGYVSVKTNALAEDCVVAKMAKLVEEAQNSKTSTQRLIDHFAKPLLLLMFAAVVVISALTAVIPIALRVHNEKQWVQLALVVLVSACPCALILSTPVVTFCAYTKAATSGLLIKGGDHLETLSKIKVMAFDKTGTITKGEFLVTSFQSLSHDVDLNALLYWVSSIESKASHPLAAAVIEYAKSMNIEPKPEKVVDFENFPGEGIRGKIDDRDIYIGNKKIATRAGSGTVPTLEDGSQGGKTTGYIYSGATPIGFFSLTDACRTGAQEAIDQLKLLGIKTAMLTGDSQAAAVQAQEQLGHALDLVHAEPLPEGKAKILTEFKNEGRTAMVGDGLNDAPALATADIGISMGISGSSLASETGNIILMSNDLRKIPLAIKLARKSHRKVIENVVLSVITKAAILGLAFAGHPLVWAAVLADVGTCLLVILNSMLLLRKGHKHGGKCCASSAQRHMHKGGCSAGNGKCSDNHDHDHGHGKCCASSAQGHMHKSGCNAGDGKCSDHHGHGHGHGHDHGKCCASSAPGHMHKTGCNAEHMHKSGCNAGDGKCSDHHDHGKCSDHHDHGKCCASSGQGHKHQSGCNASDGKCCHDHGHGDGKCGSAKESFDEVEHENAGTESDLNKCGEDHISIEIESKHGCDKVSGCCKASSQKSLEFTSARESGGCCKSYMKECCDRHGHLGAAGLPALSEIVIEQV
ncbi:putative inactive cadmium/zinc-transporting ATPase HMA3 [Senna tora]|uniref:Putative inactive cadmium/zinc-transporting ATPase HMA3 n=1 Tax=Senna tora TaxID=362788 RepID=A0A834X546_9FABA|nr:putative inactive cadmium/zinc-transporting ATPase HMA3 [Senna tora]